MCMNLNVYCVTAYVYKLLLRCAAVVWTAPAHTASGQIQSLHFKDSTPLFCQSVRIESQLHSNKISRTGSGRRGVFWELNNARREEKVLQFVLQAWTFIMQQKTSGWQGSRKCETIPSWQMSYKIFLFHVIVYYFGSASLLSAASFIQQAAVFSETPLKHLLLSNC